MVVYSYDDGHEMVMVAMMMMMMLVIAMTMRMGRVLLMLAKKVA